MVRSRTDYLLGTDRSLFSNVYVRDPRHNTDHFMVVGCLCSAPEQEHARYIRGTRKMPFRPPAEPTREDGIFEALRRAVPKPHERDKHKTHGYLRRRGGLSTREYPREGGRECERGFGDWAAPFGQAYRVTVNRGWRPRGRMWSHYWGGSRQTLRRRGDGCRGGIRLRSTGHRRPLELRSSGSRRRGLTSRATYHPQGRTSRLPLPQRKSTTRYLWKTISKTR